jgi:hypothetical protein
MLGGRRVLAAVTLVVFLAAPLVQPGLTAFREPSGQLAAGGLVPSEPVGWDEGAFAGSDAGSQDSAAASAQVIRPNGD